MAIAMTTTKGAIMILMESQESLETVGVGEADEAEAVVDTIVGP